MRDLDLKGCMDNRIFNKRVIFCVAFVLIFLALFNYFIDPFAVFQVQNKFNLYRPNVDKNHRLSKTPAFKLNKEKIEAIWIGSSKTGWSSNEEYEKSILKTNIKNLSLNGASFYESITMAKNAVQIHPEIKTIYFGIDFCMMKKYVEKPDALKPISKTNLTKEEVLPLLISLDTLQHSSKTFSKNLKKKKKPIEEYGFEKQHNKKVYHKFENTINTYYEESYKNFQFDDKKIDNLKEFINWCNAKKINVIFFTTTMHSAERILIDITGNSNNFYKFKEELAKIQPYYDFAIIDKYTTDEIKPEMQYFRDAVHAYPFLRKKITNKLFGLNDDFGYLVTKNNVKVHNIKDEKAYNKFKLKNKELIEQVENWCK